MARRRGSFGALPLVGVLTLPKVIALGAAAYVLLKGKVAGGVAPSDVEAMPQSSITPGGGGGGGGGGNSAYYSDPYSSAYDSASTYTPPYESAPVDPYLPPTYTEPQYTPPAPTNDPYSAPPSSSPSGSFFDRPGKSGSTLLPSVPLATPTRPTLPSTVLPVVPKMPLAPVSAPLPGPTMSVQTPLVLRAPQIAVPSSSLRGMAWPW